MYSDPSDVITVPHLSPAGAVSNGVRVKEKKKEKGRQSRKDSTAPEGQ